MRNLILVFFLMFIAQYGVHAQADFELDPSQSMLMTGKGKGQDGAINPYYGQDCYAIIENMRESNFSIRIQQKGEIIGTIPVSGKEVKKIKLLKGHELYFDTNAKEKVNVKLDFEKIEN